jgi:hypothetical protein
VVPIFPEAPSDAGQSSPPASRSCTSALGRLRRPLAACGWPCCTSKSSPCLARPTSTSMNRVIDRAECRPYDKGTAKHAARTHSRTAPRSSRGVMLLESSVKLTKPQRPWELIRRHVTLASPAFGACLLLAACSGATTSAPPLLAVRRRAPHQDRTHPPARPSETSRYSADWRQRLSLPIRGNL